MRILPLLMKRAYIYLIPIFVFWLFMPGANAQNWDVYWGGGSNFPFNRKDDSELPLQRTQLRNLPGYIMSAGVAYATPRGWRLELNVSHTLIQGGIRQRAILVYYEQLGNARTTSYQTGQLSFGGATNLFSLMVGRQKPCNSYWDWGFLGGISLLHAPIENSITQTFVSIPEAIESFYILSEPTAYIRQWGMGWGGSIFVRRKLYKNHWLKLGIGSLVGRDVLFINRYRGHLNTIPYRGAIQNSGSHAWAVLSYGLSIR